MKIFKLMLICILLIALTIPSSYAATYHNVYLFGDTDGDSELTVLDSTHIQRHIARMAEFDNKYLLYAADIDRDNDVTVMDATKVQRILCELDTQEPAEKYFVDDIRVPRLYSDHDSGRTYIGDTVRFRVEAESFNVSPVRYKFEVDGVTVQEGEDLTELEYTFTQACGHYVLVTVYNRFGSWSSNGGTIYVCDESLKPDSLYMTGIHFDPGITKPFFGESDSENIRKVIQPKDGISTVKVNCAGGTAPYQYRFDFDSGAQTTDFSDSNTFEVSGLKIGPTEWEHDYPLTVTIRDAEGVEIQEEITVRVVLPPVG